jgi:2-isopropylmalate synthase
VDIVTLALNLFTQGVEPGLALSDLNEIVRCAEYCTQLPVHPRHPYAGELVFTAFSGSHQDAIKKGFDARNGAADTSSDALWEVPYLPIDPLDVGRSYEAVIRVNSQSGKGGIAYLLEKDYGLRLPRRLQIEFSQVIQAITDRTGKELGSGDIWSAFRGEYIREDGFYALVEHRIAPDSQGGGGYQITATVKEAGLERIVTGHGNGPIDAFVDALHCHCGVDVQIADYREHAIGVGADATAVSYVEVRTGEGDSLFGVGMDGNIVTASLRAVTSAVNRAVGRLETDAEQAPGEDVSPRKRASA